MSHAKEYEKHVCMSQKKQRSKIRKQDPSVDNRYPPMIRKNCNITPFLNSNIPDLIIIYGSESHFFAFAVHVDR